MSSFLRLLLWLTAVSLVLLALDAFVLAPRFAFEIGGGIFLAYGFLFSLSLLVHFWVIRATQNNNRQFVNTFMGASGLKLFLSLGLLVIYITVNPEERVVFAVHFMVLYLIYTLIGSILAIQAVKKTAQKA